MKTEQQIEAKINQMFGVMQDCDEGKRPMYLRQRANDYRDILGWVLGEIDDEDVSFDE